MTRLIPLPARKVIKTLEKLGFEQKRQRGSHLFMSHPDGRSTVIPIHKGEDIGRGLMRKILNYIELHVNSFLKLLRK